MRYVKRHLVFCFFIPFLFSSSPLCAQSGSSPSDGLLDLRDFDLGEFQAEFSRYDTDYSKVANDEAPFVGGVFDREVGEPMEPIGQELPDRPDVILDENSDDTNQLIVLLNLDDPDVTRAITGNPNVFENRAAAEEAVVEALNRGQDGARVFFSNATQGWHLIGQDRLDTEAREFLDDEDPNELIQQYIVLNYASIDEARAALSELWLRRGVRHVEMNLAMEFSWSPNDPYFPINSAGAGRYQWGLHTMRFPAAWDITRGHGHVGVIDGGLPSTIPADLQQNYRPQFSFVVNSVPTVFEYHGTHVTGIVAATANNSVGVAGGCPTCSATMARMTPSGANIAAGLNGVIARGMQVANMSFGGNQTCSSSGFPAVCTAIALADTRDMLLVAAAGNYTQTQPDFPASHASVLSVGGVQNTNPANPSDVNWATWYYGPHFSDIVGSNYAGTDGVVAPARAIVSTVPPLAVYNPEAPYRCSDQTPVDESNVNGDGYGSCTGTSMAAPHVSAMAGILRSINPRMTSSFMNTLIRATGTNVLSPNAVIGSGLPRVDIAAAYIVNNTPNRLTPLFTQFSWGRRDFLMTTVPQMASAATWGTLQPANYTGTSYRYVSAGGYAITGYGSYPGAYSDPYDDYAPKAAAWIFTTAHNPKNPSVPLVPLYRLSWKCGDYTPTPPAVCSTVPGAMDTTYTADSAGVAAFQSAGYKLDGIEGYIYPKTISQPLGTVRLMRKYNPDRDDHAIFPETVISYFTSLGYTEDSGSDWLGYVYPNATGGVPVIQ